MKDNGATLAPSRTQSTVWRLAALLALSEASYLYLLKISFAGSRPSAAAFAVVMGILFLLYALACVWAQSWHLKPGRMLFIIAAGALLFRATLLCTGLDAGSSAQERIAALRADARGEAVAYGPVFFFDDDLWRYLWDGHVSAAGVDPFRYPPNAPELDKLLSTRAGNAELWSMIRSRVNHPDIPTVYPPAAQLVFRFAHWIAPGSVLIFKIIACLLDLLAAMFIALALRALNRPATDVVWYAWNPLVITMIGGGGHIDALAAAGIAAMGYFLARKKTGMAAVSFALSIASKISPVVLVLLMIKRLRWRGTALALLVLASMYLPFLSSAAVWKNLAVYVYRWQFNSAWFHSLVWLLRPVSSDPSYVARVISGLIMVIVLGWFAFHDRGGTRQFFSAAAAIMGIFLFLNPAVMPWYVVWLLPLAVMARQQIWIYFSGLVCLSVFMMTDWQPNLLVLAIEYGVFLLLALWTLYRMQMAPERPGERQGPASIPAVSAS
jgi:alpha-1,6-mannosyltransferase